MYSESDFYIEKNSFNVSQNTINIIIVIILLIIFFFLFNFCSKNYFTNLNSNSDNQIENLKNELTLFKEEFLNKKTDEKKNESLPIYNTDLQLNSNINITNLEPYINNEKEITNCNTPNIPDNDVIIQPVAPPIIYDPIENYDRLKLLDPLVDPRGRSSADQIPTPQVAAQLNFPTQGILDRYHRVGLLTVIKNYDSKNNRRRKSYEDFSNVETDSHEDFGNVEKVVKGKKVNVDSDTNSSNYDNSSRLSRYSDNSSDLQTISRQTT
jgi:hypothetical protein